LGLLILRLTIATTLIVRGISAEQNGALSKLVVPVGAALAGTLVLVGLWTPIAAGVSLSIESWLLMTQGLDKASHLHLAALELSLILLGPGRFSIDARLFGRKRIDFGRSTVSWRYPSARP
jgi:uncharacterized membrane protein YphA (DoxX/SURF4 family)